MTWRWLASVVAPRRFARRVARERAERLASMARVPPGAMFEDCRVVGTATGFRIEDRPPVTGSGSSWPAGR